MVIRGNGKGGKGHFILVKNRYVALKMTMANSRWNHRVTALYGCGTMWLLKDMHVTHNCHIPYFTFAKQGVFKTSEVSYQRTDVAEMTGS